MASGLNFWVNLIVSVLSPFVSGLEPTVKAIGDFFTGVTQHYETHTQKSLHKSGIKSILQSMQNDLKTVKNQRQKNVIISLKPFS